MRAVRVEYDCRSFEVVVGLELTRHDEPRHARDDPCGEGGGSAIACIFYRAEDGKDKVLRGMTSECASRAWMRTYDLR